MENKKEINNISNWIRPNLQNEKGEIERVLREFIGREPDEESIQQIISILDSAEQIELPDEMWQRLENTDSFYNIRQEHIEDAEQKNEEYNNELSPENKRDFQGLVNRFYEGHEIESPTILKNKEGVLHLVSGNTRLMIARALGIQPKVIIGEIDYSV